MPDFLLVGAAKSGTTSIHRYLSQHPDIFTPRYKETFFFQLISNPNKEILNRWNFLPKNIFDYLSLFYGAGEHSICGESTPSYLIFPEYTISNLKKYHPQWEKVKIIIILREPLSKILSQYRFSLRIGTETLPLNEALSERVQLVRDYNNDISIGLRYLQSTRYYHQVKMYLDNFDQVRVYTFDDFVKDRRKILYDILHFLGVEKSDEINFQEVFNTTTSEGDRKNKSLKSLLKRLMYKYPYFNSLLSEQQEVGVLREMYSTFNETHLNKTNRNYLNKIFKSDISNLQTLTGLDLSSWLQKYNDY